MKKMKKTTQLKTIEAFRGCPTCSSCQCSGQGSEGNYNNNTGTPQAPAQYK